MRTSFTIDQKRKQFFAPHRTAAHSKHRKQQAGKMADGADIDLYADDLDQDFAQVFIAFMEISPI